MNDALIGYSGFVGGSILAQHPFDHTYNSKNIEDIAGRSFELLVCAGAPGVKWKANQDPESDWQSISRLQQALSQTTAEQVVLISTVDVFEKPFQVDESTEIDVEVLQPYGKHRLLLEQFVTKHFPQVTIVRLPGLFGPGLKKNLVFDFIQRQRYETFHPDSHFQFYNMNQLWSDIDQVLVSQVPLMHFATEPVKVSDIAASVGVSQLVANRDLPVVSYDFWTKYADVFDRTGHYMTDAQTVLTQIRDFIVQEQARVE